ncbi:hypothetical protein RHMOL_Rhmol10G0186900 [Rhododendron molle]|uniref:Uncharacterized protein n=1 Tax=Rhododendron molle TaxID=49168 RepID=A0ACC0M3X6_RHOML|nr:hypothetical protein RHMOL_Rhmol10G0186900 [Rhododendron molle]
MGSLVRDRHLSRWIRSNGWCFKEPHADPRRAGHGRTGLTQISDEEEVRQRRRSQRTKKNTTRMQSADDIQPCEESGNSCEILYTPEVKNEVIPKITQEFKSLDDVFKYYNKYAFEAGFSVRIHSSKTDKNGETIRKEFVCSKEGESKCSKVSQRQRGITREKCGARLTVIKNRSGEGFVVTQFVEGHSHSLTSPRKRHFLRSHRQVSVAQKVLTQQLAAANVSTSQQMSVLELQAGGLENIGCLRRDFYNCQRDMRKYVDGHDANMLKELFESEKEKNRGFTYTIEEDDEHRLTHCFWADAISRKSYQYFGDVVVFDTTYNTNKYCLMFAPLLGVNHHGQTTLFGCAFLSDETSESFEWLFKEFLKAMPGPPPKMIITDQDPVMTKAIACALPNTFHRYCIWHIVSKFSEKIGALAYKEHYEQFKKCIWNSESSEEFDPTWAYIVEKTNLSTHQWLHSMYEIRARWVPTYTRHIFSAHMTSSQRAEISHSFFKRYLSDNNSMYEFVTRFERALARLRHNELDLDHKDINQKPVLKTSWAMEKKMSELYTLHSFKKFQEEIFQIGAYVLTIRHEDERCCVWKVHREEMEGSRGREVSVDKSSNYVSCSCKMFEFDGIPCRHLLAYLSLMQIRELPSTYLLQRWTKTAKAGRVFDDLGSHQKEICGSSLLVRRPRLFQFASIVIDDAVLDEEGTEIMHEAMASGQKKVALMRCSRQHGSTSSIQLPISLESQHGLKEPLKVRAKGCGKRLKGGKEMAVKKSRKCHGCGLLGQSHDKRNCPKLMNTSSQDARLYDDDDDDDDFVNECNCMFK